MSVTRILFIEDSPTDVVRARRELCKVGIDPEVLVVEDERHLRDALLTWDPDVIVSDTMVPGFDGFRAFDVSRELAADVPFLFRTGRVRDDRSLLALRQGACGWVSKDNGDAFAATVMNALSAPEMIRFEWVPGAPLRMRARPPRTIIEDVLLLESLTQDVQPAD